MSELSVALAALSPLQAYGAAPLAVGMVKPRSRPRRGRQRAGNRQRADS